VVQWQPEIQVVESAPARQWDGTRTRLPLALNMLRGDRGDDGKPSGPPRVLGLGDHIEVDAVYDEDGKRWLGPEAEHVEDLFRRGMILGSAAQRDLSAEATAIEHTRGAWPTADGKPAVRPELRQRDKSAAQAEWERALAGGMRQILRREKQEARADLQDQVEAAAGHTAAIEKLAASIQSSGQMPAIEPGQLAEAMVSVLKGMGLTVVASEGAEFAGAKGPGREINKIRARARKAAPASAAGPPTSDDNLEPRGEG
jgi:hypothetical protein